MTQMSATITREAKRRRRRRFLALAFAAALLPVPAADARLGDLDPSFGSGGIATPNVAATLEAVTNGPGGPVAAGTGANEAVVVQLTNAGTPDATFGASGVARFPNGAEVLRLHAIALDSQGRVLAAGDGRSSTLPAGQTTPIVQRLAASGGPGSTFPVPGPVGESHAVVPLGDAMLVAGWRAGAAQHDVFFVARLDANGNLDLSFGTRGVAEADFGVGARASAMAVDDAGRIVLAGTAGSQHALA